MYFQIGLFLWELQRIRDIFHVKCICQNILEPIGIGMAYLQGFLITMHEIDTAAEVY